MNHDRPAWAGGADVSQGIPQFKMVNIDVGQFIRTRDALTSAYLNLSSNLDRAVKAYLDHTQVVLAGDASLNVNTLLQPFNILTQQQQMAQMALQQNGGGIPTMQLPNGAAGGGELKSEEPEKKKRKKRAYKPRDPNAPKRPLTAYFRYLGETRPAIQAEIATNPELYKTIGKPGDISRIATDRWNALSEAEQKPYKEAYQAELKDYDKAAAAYKAQGGTVDETAAVDAEVMNMDGAGEGPSTAAAVGAPVEKVEAVEEDEDSDTSSNPTTDDESEEEVAAPPPPPPPPVKASPKKSALKKGGKASTTAQPTPAATSSAPIFSSINTTEPSSAPAVASSSPTRKRKGADTAAPEVESGRKKRGRKAKGDEGVVAAADEEEVQVAAPVAPMASSPPAAEASGKKKKDRKKRKE